MNRLTLANISPSNQYEGNENNGSDHFHGGAGIASRLVDEGLISEAAMQKVLQNQQK